MKKILFINEFQAVSNYGGVQRVTRMLADYFQAKGDEVYFAYFKCNDISFEYFSREFHFPSEDINCISNSKLLKSIILNLKIQVVINQMGFNRDVIKLFISVGSAIPLISCLHSSPDFELKLARMLKSQKSVSYNSLLIWYRYFFDTAFLGIKKFLIGKRLRYIYHASNHLVLLSQNFKPTFLELTKLKDVSKVEHIGNPIKLSSFGNVDLLREKEKSILYLGRINAGKRVKLLLDFWGEIHLQFPDWRFDLVGDGPELEGLMRYSELKQLSRICFHGNSSSVEGFYRKSSIFISASAFEGFPMVILEAIAHGTVPVVYNTYESVTDLIINKVTGLIVNDLDECAFVENLKDLMKSRQRRDEIALNGIKHSRRFDIMKVGSQWQKLLDSQN